MVLPMGFIEILGAFVRLATQIRTITYTKSQKNRFVGARFKKKLCLNTILAIQITLF